MTLRAALWITGAVLVAAAFGPAGLVGFVAGAAVVEVARARRRRARR